MCRKAAVTDAMIRKKLFRSVISLIDIRQQALSVIERLDETSQLSVLRFAEFLAAESDGDVTLYDKAKSDDDGYRISSTDLRKKYGI
jgi:hypothetical protein